MSDKMFPDEQFFKTHPIFTLSQHVKEICQPFFDAANINYFDYIRVYDDGTVTGLVSDRIWLEHYFKKSFTFGGTVKNSGKHLWLTYNNELLLHDARNYFNHDNGISIFYRKENYVEYFDLAAPRENTTILNLYLNHFNIIENFFQHFLSQSQELISQALTQPFPLPGNMRGTLTHDLEPADIYKSISQMKSEQISKLLTPREYQCMSRLVLGLTMKEIGRELNLSPRTVEHYVSNLKDKLGCPYRSQLVKKYVSMIGGHDWQNFAMKETP